MIERTNMRSAQPASTDTALVRAANQASFSAQSIATILKALGAGETPVDPSALDWLGQCLEEAHETIDAALQVIRQAGAG